MTGRWLILAACLSLAAAACGGTKHAASVVASPSPTAAATPVPAGLLTVSPVSGPLGDVFTLKASRFHAAETVRFTITPPTGKPFTGPPHAANASGVATATYKPSTTGRFTVAAAGTMAGHAAGVFTVTAPPVVHTAPRPTAHPMAPAKPAATARPAPTATPYNYNY
jgi:hypothetical protein